MKQKKVVFLILILSLVVIIISIVAFINSKNIYYKVSELSEYEQNKLSKIYKDGKISKGKLFDVKYDYFLSPDDFRITLIKKIDKNILALKITVIAKSADGKKIIIEDFPLNEVYQEFQNDTEHPHIWSDGSHGLILGDVDNQNVTNNLIIDLTYAGGEEMHYITAPIKEN